MEISRKYMWFVVFLLIVTYLSLGIAFEFILKNHHIIKTFSNLIVLYRIYFFLTLFITLAVLYISLKKLFDKVERQNERIELINRLYRTLSKINSLIISAEDRNELMKDACEVFVNYGGFKFAWAALYESGKIKPVSCIGPGDFTVEIDRVLSSIIPLEKTEIGRNLKKGEIFLVEDIEKNETWIKDLLRFNFKSCAYIPINIDGQFSGVIGIFSEKPLIINDPEEIRLLKEIQGDLSFAFSMMKRLEFERLLLRAFEQSDEMIFITDSAGKILFANRAVEKITGFSQKEIVGSRTTMLCSGMQSEKDVKEFLKLIKSGKTFSWLWTNRRKSGEIYQVQEVITPVKNTEGEITHYVTTARDITEEWKLREKLEKTIYTDPVTGLPNKLALEERIELAVENADRRNETVALFYIDLFGFSEINNTYGFKTGDMILREMATRLKKVAENNFVARIGADEFAVLIEGIRSEDEVRFWLNRILELSKTPFEVAEVYLDFNIGVAVYPDGKGTKDLMSHADAALKHSRKRGPSYNFFTDEITERMKEKLTMDSKLREAVRSRKFQLYYQPQVDLRSGRIVGFEALMRWYDEDLGWISPVDFIPELETFGLIVEIGDWVIEKACSDAKKLMKVQPDLRMSINLSPVQLKEDILFTKILSKINNLDIDPRKIAFEVTETDIIQNIETVGESFKLLRNMGVQIDIDDFGTGYSSLAYLRKLPIDHIKIDRSFVMNMTDNQEDDVIVRAISRLSHELGFRVIAEGVETREHVTLLKKIGLEYGQGYFFAKPLPLEKSLELLKNSQKHPFEV